MDTVEKRFLTAASSEIFDAHSFPNGSPGGWIVTKKNHPIDGFPMMRAERNIGGTSLQRDRHTQPTASFAVTGVRYGDTAESVEIRSGVVLRHRLQSEYRHRYLAADGCVGLVWCESGEDVEDGNANTTIIRGNWAIAGTAPQIFGFRARPMIAGDDEHLLLFQKQLPTGWPRIAEAKETVFSGKNGQAFVENDYMYIGIPWLHDHAEIVLRLPLYGLEKVVAELYRALTPPPASPSD